MQRNGIPITRLDVLRHIRQRLREHYNYFNVELSVVLNDDIDDEGCWLNITIPAGVCRLAISDDEWDDANTLADRILAAGKYGRQATPPTES